MTKGAVILPFRPDIKRLKWYIAAGALTAVLLHPVSIVTLGAGVVLGCRGRAWLEALERSISG